MKKKGFTLVELLAVIAILAILVILALPNVMGMYQNAQKNAFVTELESILKAGNTQFVSDNMAAKGEATSIAYTRAGGQFLGANTNTAWKRNSENAPKYKVLDLQGSTEINFYLEYNLAGKAIAFYATDGRYQFAYEGEGIETGKIFTPEISKSSANCNGDDTKGLTKLKFNTTAAGARNEAPINTGVIVIADAVEYCPKESVTIFTLSHTAAGQVSFSAQQKGNVNKTS